MAHYAVLNENNIVTMVFVGKNENELDNDGNVIDWEVYYGAKRTSYNTNCGVHLTGGTPFRKNYAGIGYKYDEIRDAFIPPKPFDSWILDEESCQWKSPVPRPSNDLDNGIFYEWNEVAQQWEVIAP